MLKLSKSGSSQYLDELPAGKLLHTALNSSRMESRMKMSCNKLKIKYSNRVVDL